MLASPSLPRSVITPACLGEMQNNPASHAALIRCHCKVSDRQTSMSNSCKRPLCADHKTTALLQPQRNTVSHNAQSARQAALAACTRLSDACAGVHRSALLHKHQAKQHNKQQPPSRTPAAAHHARRAYRALQHVAALATPRQLLLAMPQSVGGTQRSQDTRRASRCVPGRTTCTNTSLPHCPRSCWRSS